jgi:hypothetical protein
MMVTANPPRTLRAHPLGSPPAVWAAFASQARWKNWVLLGQVLCLLLLMSVCLQLAKTEPDVVVVGPEGEGAYVRRSVANAELLRFLAEQKSQPADLTVLAFTRRFVKSTLQVNSTTFAEDWAEALSLMAPGLREKFLKESKEQKLVETNQLLQVRTRLAFDDVQLVERQRQLFHVRALVQRERSRLFQDGSAPVTDALQVELVLSAVRRTPERPDGLEVFEWRVAPRPTGPEKAEVKQ